MTEQVLLEVEPGENSDLPLDEAEKYLKRFVGSVRYAEHLLDAVATIKKERTLVQQLETRKGILVQDLAALEATKDELASTVSKLEGRRDDLQRTIDSLRAILSSAKV